MLSDGTLRSIKPQATAYKIADRDGMYVTVSAKVTITFRLDYRLNGRWETLTIGRYGSKDGISLLMARERCTEARKAIAEGRSPSQEKQREKLRTAEAKTFEEFTKRWLEEARMAEGTKSMRKSIIGRDIMPVFRNRLMAEIGAEDLRNLCAKVKASGSPATALHVRDIVKQVFGFAALHGEKAPNPADEVGPSSIATFVAKDGALSPSEIRVMHRVLDATATLPTIRLALRLILLTLVRKSELIEATWDEVDFENAGWTIPKSRMKAGKSHDVYLSQQALDIMVALRTCASGSKFLLPSRYDADRCMSKATLNRVTQIVVERRGSSDCGISWLTILPAVLRLPLDKAPAPASSPRLRMPSTRSCSRPPASTTWARSSPTGQRCRSPTRSCGAAMSRTVRASRRRWSARNYSACARRSWRASRRCSCFCMRLAPPMGSPSVRSAGLAGDASRPASITGPSTCSWRCWGWAGLPCWCGRGRCGGNCAWRWARC